MGCVICAAAALLSATAAHAGEGPDRQAAVRALLARSRLLQDVRFEVPLEAWTAYRRAQAAGPEAPPVPVSHVAAAGTYALDVAKGTLTARLRLHVFDPSGCQGLPSRAATR